LRATRAERSFWLLTPWLQNNNKSEQTSNLFHPPTIIVNINQCFLRLLLR
jgi:hypothetical protein